MQPNSAASPPRNIVGMGSGFEDEDSDGELSDNTPPSSPHTSLDPEMGTALKQSGIFGDSQPGEPPALGDSPGSEPEPVEALLEAEIAQTGAGNKAP